MRSSHTIARLMLAGAVFAAAASTDIAAQGTRPVRPSIATRPARPATARAATPAVRGQRGQQVRRTEQRLLKQRLMKRKLIKRRMANATPEQQVWMKSFAAQRKTVRQQVQAGTLDRQTARAQLKQWREANVRPRRVKVRP